jgi:hypothetical protein
MELILVVPLFWKCTLLFLLFSELKSLNRSLTNVNVDKHWIDLTC